MLHLRDQFICWDDFSIKHSQNVVVISPFPFKLWLLFWFIFPWMLRNSCCSKKFVTHLSLGLHINCTLNIPCYVGIIDNVNKVFFHNWTLPLSLLFYFSLLCVPYYNHTTVWPFLLVFIYLCAIPLYLPLFVNVFLLFLTFLSPLSPFLYM